MLNVDVLIANQRPKNVKKVQGKAIEEMSPPSEFAGQVEVAQRCGQLCSQDRRALRKRKCDQ